MICPTDKPPIQAKTENIKKCFKLLTSQLCWTIGLRTSQPSLPIHKRQGIAANYWPVNCADLNDLPYRQATNSSQYIQGMFQNSDHSHCAELLPYGLATHLIETRHCRQLPTSEIVLTYMLSHPPRPMKCHPSRNDYQLCPIAKILSSSTLLMSLVR